MNELTEGKKLSVVYDSVGKTTFQKSLNSLARRGMLVHFGQSSGAVPTVDPQVLNQKGSLYLTRPTLFHYAAAREDLLERAGQVFEWIRNSKLRISIFREVPLADAAEAHRMLESRETTGKLVLIP